MVVFELVHRALDWLSSLVGVEIDAVILLALSAILVGAYYAREVAGILVRAARVIQIGGTVAALILVLVVVGIGIGALSLDGGLVESVLRQLGTVVRSVHV